VPTVSVKYDDFSTIAAALISSAAALEKNPGGIVVLPVSMTHLFMSEYYDLAMHLMTTLGLTNQEQFIVCIDADENSALAEHFDCGADIFFTLEELGVMRRELATSSLDFRVFGKSPRFYHVVKDDVYSRDAYQRGIYRHLRV
jgi:hypothetical protein